MQNLHKDKQVLLKDIESRKTKLPDLEEHKQQVTFNCFFGKVCNTEKSHT